MLSETGPLEGTFFEAIWWRYAQEVPVFTFLGLGMAGMYLGQRGAGGFGKLGKIGSYLFLAGYATTVVGDLFSIPFELALGENATPAWLFIVTHIVGFLVFAVGLLLFSIATFRARVLPRGGALLVLAGMVGSMVAPMGWPYLLAGVAFGLGWIWLGYGLWSHRAAELVQPQRAVR